MQLPILARGWVGRRAMPAAPTALYRESEVGAAAPLASGGPRRRGVVPGSPRLAIAMVVIWLFGVVE